MQIAKKKLDKFIDMAIEKNAVEITAYLMDYKNRIYGSDHKRKIEWED